MIQPVIITPDLDRLARFYTELLGAEPGMRVPPEGPIFYQTLHIGSGDLGLVADADVEVGTAQRILISIDVGNVDELLQKVDALGGQVRGPANDMPWGQRVGHIKDPDGNSINLTQPLGE